LDQDYEGINVIITWIWGLEMIFLSSFEPKRRTQKNRSKGKKRVEEKN
jgi:hypothetical protein